MSSGSAATITGLVRSSAGIRRAVITTLRDRSALGGEGIGAEPDRGGDVRAAVPQDRRPAQTG